MYQVIMIYTGLMKSAFNSLSCSMSSCVEPKFLILLQTLYDSPLYLVSFFIASLMFLRSFEVYDFML